MSASNYLETAILNEVLRGINYVNPASVYIALFLSDPTDTGAAGTEVGGGGYARKVVTFNAPTQINGKATVSSSADVEFPQATANWGTITHFAIMDAAANGNILFSNPLATTKVIDTGDTLRFKAGEIVVDID